MMQVALGAPLEKKYAPPNSPAVQAVFLFIDGGGGRCEAQRS